MLVRVYIIQYTVLCWALGDRSEKIGRPRAEKIGRPRAEKIGL